MLTGGQIHSITFMSGDVQHMHLVSSVAKKNPELNILLLDIVAVSETKRPQML